jgi:hypothetical protein
VYGFCVNNAWKLLVFCLKECRKPPSQVSSQLLPCFIIHDNAYSPDYSLGQMVTRASLLSSSPIYRLLSDMALFSVSINCSCPCFYWFPLSSFTGLRLNQIAHVRFDLFAVPSLGSLFSPEKGDSTFLRSVCELLCYYQESYKSQKMVHVTLTGLRLSNLTLQLFSLIRNNNSSFRNLSHSFLSFPDILKKTHVFAFCLNRVSFLMSIIKRMAYSYRSSKKIII